MNLIRKILKLISDAFGAVAMLFLAFLMFGITADVITRAITGNPISGVFEMSELSLVMIVFLGAMWAQNDHAHIRVNILTRKLSGLPHRIAMAFSWGCGALALFMFAWSSTQEAIYSVSIWEFRWGYIQFPIWWTKVGVAVGLWLAAIQMTFHAVTALIHDEAEETSSVAEA
ncbi:TRAP-type C4-dicarboxylate transport system, small permease component [Roseovarius sp. EC-HK134]|jgi:TRAP-type C4-dicarboxylate transport system permease small subunit|uniref:TRAP transporter small permease n=1 Tax=unclassified Roseovarius TaxID=2614913 RepID=UPI001257078A|nr:MULTISPECIES: TRAP transporter small permease [unclassified Roseovarius]VVS98140.1 TRAP-type C4-dicarboxylate transport system, small permease component [Roseovarius sp. EC-SD190]VVS99346.1 TRAP-type C4-dicarboxylate transport system, small permease component [Roseovarius sp. EC-HK134]